MSDEDKVISIDPFFANSKEELDQPEEDEESPEEEPVDEESEDDDEQDTSEEESDDADGQDEEEDDEDDEGDDDSDKDPEPKGSWKAKAKAAENHRKDMQSERDMLRNQVQQQMSSMNRIEQQIANLQQTHGDDNSGLAGDDENLVTVAELKKILKSKPAPTQQSTNISREESDWAYSQPDFEEVNKYANDKGLTHSPEISGLQTNLVGRYQAVRAKIATGEKEALRKENKKLVTQIKKLKKRKTKPRMPTIGAGTHPSSKGRSNDSADSADRFWGS